jgi:hypothetical protein
MEMFDNVGCDVSDIFVWPDVLSNRVLVESLDWAREVVFT